MILVTIGLALFSAVVCAVAVSVIQGEKLPSFEKNEQGHFNPMLPWWISLSLVHVGIVFALAYILYSVNVIKLHGGFDPTWFGIIYFLSYWIFFEMWYWVFHRLQHLVPCFGYLTGHNGDSSEKFHHGMKPPHGPDYLTAFSGHPLDSLIVQLAAQSPWIVGYMIGLSTGVFLKASCVTYGITITWLAFIGMRAHARKSFGGKYHCKHHDDPSKGPYSFSGIPEPIINKLIQLFYL